MNAKVDASMEKKNIIVLVRNQHSTLSEDLTKCSGTPRHSHRYQGTKTVGTDEDTALLSILSTLVKALATFTG